MGIWTIPLVKLEAVDNKRRGAPPKWPKWGNCEIGSTFCLRKKFFGGKTTYFFMTARKQSYWIKPNAFHRTERIMMCPYTSFVPVWPTQKHKHDFIVSCTNAHLCAHIQSAPDWLLGEPKRMCFFRGRRRPDPFVLVSQSRLKRTTSVITSLFIQRHL